MSTVHKIDDRASAVRRHAVLRIDASSPLLLGRFYRDLLERKLWATQADLVRELEISRSQLSRSLAFANIPDEVLAAFDEAGPITVRMAAALNSMIARIGRERVVRNALVVPRQSGMSVDAIFATISTGERQGLSATDLKLTVAVGSRRGRYLRLELAEIDSVIPRIEALQAWIHMWLNMPAPKRP